MFPDSNRWRLISYLKITLIFKFLAKFCALSSYFRKYLKAENTTEELQNRSRLHHNLRTVDISEAKNKRIYI